MAVILGVLPVQIVYKLASALFLPWRNPVIGVNLAVCALHGVTLNAAL